MGPERWGRGGRDTFSTPQHLRSTQARARAALALCDGWRAARARPEDRACSARSAEGGRKHTGLWELVRDVSRVSSFECGRTKTGSESWLREGGSCPPVVSTNLRSSQVAVAL